MKGEGSDFSAYIDNLANKLGEKHTVDLYPLEKMNLHYCIGCWSCWWKSPGRCAIKDDAEPILKSVINSDFVIFASPLMAGFTSSSLKKITDRLVVHLHPYVKLKNGECHHKKRYDKYPDIGLIIEKETDTDEEDLSIVKEIYDRLAINFHCTSRYMKIANQDTIEEVVYETCNN